MAFLSLVKFLVAIKLQVLVTYSSHNKLRNEYTLYMQEIGHRLGKNNIITLKQTQETVQVLSIQIIIII